MQKPPLITFDDSYEFIIIESCIGLRYLKVVGKATKVHIYD